MSFLPEKGVVSSRSCMRRHSTSFDVIEHHMLIFHTHSFRCCIHTSYGPTCRIRTHSTSFDAHVSYTYHYTSFTHRIIRSSFTSCIICYSYDIIQHHTQYTSYTHHTLMHHMLSLCHIHYHILDLHEVVYSYSIIQIIRMSYNVIHEPHTLESEMSLYDYV